MIELLGDIKEPLSRSTLAKIAEHEQNTLVRDAALRALARIDAQTVESSAYSELSANQRWLAVVMVSLVCVLLPFMIYRFRKDEDKRLALLALVPILICGGFAVLIAIEYSRGRLHFGAMDARLREGSVMIVRTASYHDQTDFPGDSYVARRLLETGDASVLSALNASSLAEPDDLDALKRMNEVRRDWIWSRMLVSKLGSPGLQDLARDGDLEIRLAVATALGKLMVTHDEIVAALELLEKDEDDRVRTKAAEALARSRSFPKWSPP